MTNDELAAKIDAQFERIDEKFNGIDKRFEGIDKKFDGFDKKFDGFDKKFDGLEQTMKEGFDASRARDEELRDLTKFGLEAREILRDEMHRRFDESDRKTDLQLTLLKDAVGHLTKPK